MRRRLCWAMLTFFLSPFLLTVHRQHGSDQFIAAVLTGQALVVGRPIGRLAAPWRLVNLGPYGGFDLWLTHRPHDWHSAAAPGLAVIGVSLLLVVVLASLIYLWPRLPASTNQARPAA